MMVYKWRESMNSKKQERNASKKKIAESQKIGVIWGNK